MTISHDVRQQFFVHVGSGREQLIRIPPSSIRPVGPTRRAGTLWSEHEHERFLRGLELFPHGPWRRVAEVVGTRTTRQTMTHAQKYRQKIARHKEQRSAENRARVRTPQTRHEARIFEVTHAVELQSVRNDFQYARHEPHRVRSAEASAVEWLLRELDHTVIPPTEVPAPLLWPRMSQVTE